MVIKFKKFTVEQISNKRWCYDYELAQQALEEINKKKIKYQ